MRDVRANSEVSDDPAGDPPAQLSVRVSVVLHEPAAGRTAPVAHLDLFVGPVDCADPDARVARSWRLPLGAWTSEGPVAGRFAALETPPHRAAYLSIAAPFELSDGRGRVTPLAKTTGIQHTRPADTGRGGILRLEAFGHRIALFPRDGGNWTVTIAKEGPWILP